MSKQPETSLESKALKTDESKSRDYEKIIMALKVIGEANYEGIAIQLKLTELNTVSRRLKEMRELGLLENTGQKTLTSRGRNAFVHRLTELGKNTVSAIDVPKSTPKAPTDKVKVREHFRTIKKEMSSRKSIQQKLL